ncbi:hypothetical protein QBC45DRAFT_405232, partial [Copromyces sp. CBS 386.78]
MTVTNELWRHQDPQSTQMWKFLEHVNSKYGLQLNDYPSLGIRNSKLFDEVG